MFGTKYLSEAIHSEEIEKGVLNLVNAPVGSGKTHWALNVLSKSVSKPYKMVYLIDTINGKEQLLKHPNTQYYSREWQETIRNDKIWFGEAVAGNRIVVMTYAKFGVLADRYSDFAYSFELILCDEIHNLPRFSSFISRNPNDIPYHKIAKAQLEKVIMQGKTTVIGLSATPRRAATEMCCEKKFIAIDRNVRRFETKQYITYTNAEYLLNELKPTEKGIAYIGHVAHMKKFEEEAISKGFRAISVWSVNNTDHPMNEEQHRVRDYILANAALPPEYDLFIINASSETSINIFGRVDYIVIHTQELEPQIQVRGRFRGDLDRLYMLDYKAPVAVPDSFMGRKLFQKEKNELCAALNLHNEQGRLMKWTSVKERILYDGYAITEGRANNKRYTIITK